MSRASRTLGGATLDAATTQAVVNFRLACIRARELERQDTRHLSPVAATEHRRRLARAQNDKRHSLVDLESLFEADA